MALWGRKMNSASTLTHFHQNWLSGSQFAYLFVQGPTNKLICTCHMGQWKQSLSSVKKRSLLVLLFIFQGHFWTQKNNEVKFVHFKNNRGKFVPFLLEKINDKQLKLLTIGNLENGAFIGTIFSPLFHN